MLKAIVTGCGGFIGSHLTQKLLADGFFVEGLDNFSTGNERFLSAVLPNRNFNLNKIDILEPSKVSQIFENGHILYHLAANADVRFGPNDTKRDLNQNTIGTYNVLEAARLSGIRKVVFSSTGSVYGQASIIPTPETCPFPLQTSFYGASKLAGEGLVQAFCESFGMQSWIFRFVSILGERYTHGHVFDFYQQLKSDPTKLYVLGNGKQRKSYLYVHDCISAIRVAVENSMDRVNLFNLGVDNYCDVNDSIGWIVDELGVAPNITYAGGEKGWIGDNPFIFLDTKKIMDLGWKPQLTIEDSVRRTVKFLRNNEWVFQKKR